LVECAWGATRKKDCFLKRKYESMIARRGRKKSLIAIGHKIIESAYLIIQNKETYKEPLLNSSPKGKNRKIKNYLARLRELGLEVEIKVV